MRGKIIIDGYHFNNEQEYTRYLGILELIKIGRLKNLEVKPKFPLIVNEKQIDFYSPTFKFYDPAKNIERVIQVMSSGASNSLLELRMRWFEAFYGIMVERW